MQRVLSLVVLAGLLLSMGVKAVGAAKPVAGSQRQIPEFGLILNEDGDMALNLADPEPAVMHQRLQAQLDSLKGTPFKTLAYSLATGSDILQYPTKVGSIIGWREVEMEKSEPWKSRMPGLRQAARAGLDAPRAAGEWAKRNGLFYLLTYRMNDGHYAGKPDGHALTGEFFVKHRDRLTFQTPTVAELPAFKNLLDYSHEEVRDYRLGILVEAAERYQDVMDGVELDFLRHAVLFPRGTEQERASLLTAMVAGLRAKLDELGAKNGRDYCLAVRVPVTLRHCRQVGIDLEEWVRRRLIDAIVPSQGMTVSYDMPVDEFVRLAAPAGIRVYPTVCSRTQFSWSFTLTPPTTYTGDVTNLPSVPALRGALINYRSAGAAGLEIYNYNIPLNSYGHDLVTAWLTPEGNRTYAITAAYHKDFNDYSDPRKQIPVGLNADKAATVQLLIGEDLSAATARTPLRSALRLGFNGTDLVKSLSPLTVKVNGRVVHEGAIGERFSPVGEHKKVGNIAYQPPDVQGLLQIPLRDLAVLRKGKNSITITRHGSPGRPDVTPPMLCEVLLGVVLESSRPEGTSADGAGVAKARYAVDRDGNRPRPLIVATDVCAWPALTRLPDGTILVVNYNQPSHGRMVGDVDCWASKDDGRTWSKRAPAAPHDPGTLSNRMNVAFGLDLSGNAMLIASGWSLKEKPSTAPAAPDRPYDIDEVQRAWVSHSSDGGKSWSIDRESFPELAPDGGVLIPYGSVCVGKDGALRVAAYSALDRKKWHRAYVCRSSDNGKTWPEIFPIDTNQRFSETFIHHVGDGRWIALARSDRLEQYESTDDGRTWRPAVTATGKAAYPASVITLSDGQLLLCSGNRSDGNLGVDARTSADGGKTWSEPVRIVEQLDRDCGYPSSVQLPDGRVVTAYYGRKAEYYDGYHMAVITWDPKATFSGQ